MFASFLDETRSRNNEYPFFFVANLFSLQTLYITLKAFAKTFMISDVCDSVACCKYLNAWYAAFDTSAKLSPEYKLNYFSLLDTFSMDKISIFTSKICRKVPTIKVLCSCGLEILMYEI